MPRRPRVSADAAVYHVYCRFAHEALVFADREEARRFLAKLREVVRTDGVTIFAWCLMPTHYHQRPAHRPAAPVAQPAAYPHSGHRELLGRVRAPLLDVDATLRLYGAKRSAAVRSYATLARGVNKHALRANYLSALAAVRDSALDAAYYHKQYERHVGHPKPHVVAILALARQRFKVKYKLMTTSAVYDKEILIASHLDREHQTVTHGPRAA